MEQSTHPIGKPERNTQNRIIALFRDELGYRFLGDRSDRLNNSNTEEDLLSAYLIQAGYTMPQISRAIYLLRLEADNPNRSSKIPIDYRVKLDGHLSQTGSFSVWPAILCRQWPGGALAFCLNSGGAAEPSPPAAARAALGAGPGQDAFVGGLDAPQLFLLRILHFWLDRKCPQVHVEFAGITTFRSAPFSWSRRNKPMENTLPWPYLL